MNKEEISKVILKAKKGDANAFGVLFEQYHQEVYNVAMRVTRDRSLSEDIVQETFVEVIKTIDKLQDPAAFASWLKTIAHHQCTRHYRRKEVLHETLVEEAEDGFSTFETLEERNTAFIPDAALDEKEFKQTIHELMNELPDVQSAALIMFYLDGLSLRQIAQAQGVPLNTANTRLNRGRKAMQKTVEAYEKKHDIRLHSVALFPLFAWLFKGMQEAMSVEATVTAVEGIIATTGVSIAAGGTGAAAAGAAATSAATATGVATGISAKIAALPLVTKVIGAVVAALIAVTPPVVIALNDGLSGEENRGSVSQEQERPTEPENVVVLIPQDCQYTVAKTGEVLTAGKPFPETPETGDIFRDPIAGYEYAFNSEVLLERVLTETDGYYVHSFGPDKNLNGWCVTVIDRSRERYGEILASICSEPVKSMELCFYRCQNMTQAPEIPASVVTIQACFETCTSLLKTPVLPYGLTNISSAFNRTYALHTVEAIPATVKEMDWAFTGCINLTGTIRIDANPEIMDGAFKGTEKQITLYGRSKCLSEMAETSEGSNVTYRTDILYEVDETGTREDIYSQLSLEERIRLNKFLHMFSEMGGIPIKEEDMFDVAFLYADTHIGWGPGDPWLDAVPEAALQATAQRLFGRTFSNDAMPEFIWYENGVYYTDVAFTEMYFSMYLIAEVYDKGCNAYGIVFEDYSFVEKRFEYGDYVWYQPEYDAPLEEWYGFAPEDAKMCEDLEYSYTSAVVVQVNTQPDGTETYQIVVE